MNAFNLAVNLFAVSDVVMSATAANHPRAQSSARILMNADYLPVAGTT
jgi:hypothetical protein